MEVVVDPVFLDMVDDDVNDDRRKKGNSEAVLAFPSPLPCTSSQPSIN